MNVYKELVRSFVNGAYATYKDKPSDDGNATLYDDVVTALEKWNLTIEDVLSERFPENIDYEKVALQLIFDVGYSASIAKDCQMDDEYKTLLIMAGYWRHKLPDGHSARMIKTNGAYSKRLYTEYCDKYGLIKNN